jgi:hypothetical protein
LPIAEEEESRTLTNGLCDKMVKKIKLLSRIMNNPGNVKFENLVKIVMKEKA